jgi:mRNA interferase HigB
VAEQPLRAWFQEVEGASWKGPVEVRARYGTADFVAGNRVIFDIRGNKYRLVAQVKYGPLFLVYIRFLGTHAEYDKIDASTI